MVKLHIDYTQEYSEDLLALLNDQTEVFELFGIVEDEEGGDDIQMIPHFGTFSYKYNDIHYNISYDEIHDCIHEGEKEDKLLLIVLNLKIKIRTLKLLKICLFFLKRNVDQN